MDGSICSTICRQPSWSSPSRRVECPQHGKMSWGLCTHCSKVTNFELDPMDSLIGCNAIAMFLVHKSISSTPTAIVQICRVGIHFPLFQRRDAIEGLCGGENPFRLDELLGLLECLLRPRPGYCV